MSVAKPLRPVCIDSAAAFCAAGENLGAIWDALCSGQRGLRPWPDADDPPPSPWPEVLPIDAPTAAALQVDRRTLRMMDKQAAMALLGASRAVQGSAAFATTAPEHIGLYLGLPTVDEPAPPWPVLQAAHAAGLAEPDTALCLRESPPFAGLTGLNATAAAHISSRFGLMGPMGICSPWADSGLQAFIEATLAIAEGHGDAAVAGAVSPKINPSLLLRLEAAGWWGDATRIPAEGAAFAVLSPRPPGPSDTRVAGHARGCVQPGTAAAAPARRVLVDQALAAAQITRHDLGWTLDHTHAWLGELGPAGPVLALLLAHEGLRRGRRLRIDAQGRVHGDEALPSPHALIVAEAPHGPCAALVLSQGVR